MSPNTWPGLPSTQKDEDEDAKRFDMLVLRRKLAQLETDAVAAERLREQIQNIASGLLNQTADPFRCRTTGSARRGRERRMVGRRHLADARI